MSNNKINLIGAIIASFVGGTVFNYNNMKFLAIPFGVVIIVAIYYAYIFLSKDYAAITGEQEIKIEDENKNQTISS